MSSRVDGGQVVVGTGGGRDLTAIITVPSAGSASQRNLIDPDRFAAEQAADNPLWPTPGGPDPGRQP